jgi:hypothetical protein
MIPQKIKIISDGNELEYQSSIIDKKKPTHLIYKYTKSITKLGELMGWSEFEIEKLLENKLIEIL